MQEELRELAKLVLRNWLPLELRYSHFATHPENTRKLLETCTQWNPIIRHAAPITVTPNLVWQVVTCGRNEAEVQERVKSWRDQGLNVQACTQHQYNADRMYNSMTHGSY